MIRVDEVLRLSHGMLVPVPELELTALQPQGHQHRIVRHPHSEHWNSAAGDFAMTAA